MSAFKSLIAEELNDYLSIRQMTFEVSTATIDRHVLGDFDSYFSEHCEGEKAIKEDLINGWIQTLQEKNHSRTVSDKVSCLRCFLRYLRYCGVEVFMPQCPKWHADYVPYIFSDEEINKIIQCSDEIQYSSSNIGNFKTAMLIRLLYGCGLRHGEALQLVRSDVDFIKGTLLLRKAKNKKQRIVPMHSSLIKMLMQYCVSMDIFEAPDAFLFPGKNPDAPMSMSNMFTRFRKILIESEIYTPQETPRKRGQCIHCLRHVFAVKSFMQAEQNGRSTADSVPYLSVYLGHFDMDGTEKYLKFSSDIFPEHTYLFENYSTGVFSVPRGAK